MTNLADRVLDCFPAGNLAIGALLRLLDIVESREVPTAAVEVTAEPRLLVNPDFAAAHAATPERLLMLVLHELHHVLLGHTTLFPCKTPTDNFVFDAVINALLSRLLPQPEFTSLLTGFYDARSFPECLLRPPSGWDGHRVRTYPKGLDSLPEKQRAEVRHVYGALYSDGGATYEDVLSILPKAVEKELGGLKLLGGHGEGGKEASTGDIAATSPALLEGVRTIVSEWEKPPSPFHGRSLADLFSTARIRPRPAISKRAALVGLLRRVAGATGRGLYPQVATRQITVLGAIPGHDRRILVQTALGARPLLHPAQIEIRRVVPTGEQVHLYLDVSGSMSEILPPLYGALADCQPLLHPRVHLFSTGVWDIAAADLARGIVKSNQGTDIACVADHMVANKVRRACIVTDGYVGSPRGKALETLRQAQLGVAFAGNDHFTRDLGCVADHSIYLPRGD